jgi:hypothetical protein
MQRLYFQKDQAEFINTAYEIKAATIYFFTKHGKYFYLMDESMQIKKFLYDPILNKIKPDAHLDFPKLAKDSWSIKGILSKKNYLYILL